MGSLDPREVTLWLEAFVEEYQKQAAHLDASVRRRLTFGRSTPHIKVLMPRDSGCFSAIFCATDLPEGAEVESDLVLCHDDDDLVERRNLLIEAAKEDSNFLLVLDFDEVRFQRRPALDKLATEFIRHEMAPASGSAGETASEERATSQSGSPRAPAASRAPRAQSYDPAVDARAVNAVFDLLRLHPDIIVASEALFKSGSYAEAVFRAFKAISGETGEADSDGKTDGRRGPLIKLNRVLTSPRVEAQEAFEFLFAGALVDSRHVRASEVEWGIDPFIALEYLGLASLLLREAERAGGDG